MAPPLVGGTAWLGTDQPIELAQLRGHVVILDFWTYCCINCLHMIPELRRVEREFAGKPVAVIGVHSGKFDAEKDPENIRQAMARYDVRHPVVIDSEYAIWQSYGVRGWPTLVVIDPEGRVVRQIPGEPKQGFLSNVIDTVLEQAEADNTLIDTPLQIHAKTIADTGPLAYPGKVATATDGRIAIADSNHHRIALVSANGDKLDVVGSGIQGSVDGPFEDAAFNRPQGMAFDATGNILYVADTENHQLRALDLVGRTVRTIAGTGRKGMIRKGGPAMEVDLRSPWDIEVDGDTLYVAMAGSHQIWRYHIGTEHIVPFAGTGEESIKDGSIMTATFSQPSGLSLRNRTLYIADSEVSAIRAIDLNTATVRTIVGTGLFDFGDVDGKGDKIRLQHALGVTHVGDMLYVADTYNNKIKRLDPRTRTAHTIPLKDGRTLYEPSGLAALPDGRLLIADTNHHRIRILDPQTGDMRDLPLRGLEPPATKGLVLASLADGDASRVQTGDTEQADERVTIDAIGVLGPGSSTLAIWVEPPADGKLSQGTPVVIKANGKTGIEVPARTAVEYDKDKLPIRIPVDIDENADGRIDIDLSYFWCTTGDEYACIPERARLTVQLSVNNDASPGEASFTHRASGNR